MFDFSHCAKNVDYAVCFRGRCVEKDREPGLACWLEKRNEGRIGKYL